MFWQLLVFFFHLFFYSWAHSFRCLLAFWRASDPVALQLGLFPAPLVSLLPFNRAACMSREDKRRCRERKGKKKRPHSVRLRRVVYARNSVRSVFENELISKCVYIYRERDIGVCYTHKKRRKTGVCSVVGIPLGLRRARVNMHLCGFTGVCSCRVHTDDCGKQTHKHACAKTTKSGVSNELREEKNSSQGSARGPASIRSVFLRCYTL